MQTPSSGQQGYFQFFIIISLGRTFLKLNLFTMSLVDIPGSGMVGQRDAFFYGVLIAFTKLPYRYGLTCFLLCRKLSLIPCIVTI